MDKYTEIAIKYAEDVISGEIPAGKYIILQCKSFISDLYDGDHEYYFDEKSSTKACTFVENQYHTKGEWLTKKLKLVMEPWQIFFVANIFGWKKNKDDLRRYREVLLLVPRKNGKSQLAAAIGLYMLCADGEGGAEVYCGATSEKQAKEVFIPAKIMCEKNSDMLSHFGLDVRVQNINIPKSGSKFEMLIGNPGDGGSPSCAIIDEYHEHKDDSLFSTMETGTMARRQPLLIVTTTAGDNMSGPCYAMQREAEKNLDSTLPTSKTLFAMIYGIDEGDDWQTEESLRKANPNFGVSVVADVVLSKLSNALENPRKQSAYKTKHLNIWVGALEAFFNTEKWIAGNSNIKLEDYRGQRAYLSFDLATRVDIADINILIPQDNGDLVTFNKHYLPENSLHLNEAYAGWKEEGWLTITDGDIIDYNKIQADIEELASIFDVIELPYDPHQATMLVTNLMNQQLPVIEIRPTKANFSEPMKSLDAGIIDGKILHNNDPIMTWMVSNVVAKEDPMRQVYPRKDRDSNKIDGVICLIMNIGRHEQAEDSKIDFNNLLTVTL